MGARDLDSHNTWSEAADENAVWKSDLRPEAPERRRTALLLGLVALSFYLGFILLSVARTS